MVAANPLRGLAARRRSRAFGRGFGESEPGGPQVGLEHEFIVRREGRAVDFRTLIGDLAVPGERLDPGDRFAHRTVSGLALTCDGPEAEYAAPPVPLAPGFTDELAAWAGTGGSLLGELLPEHEVEGVSTHLSVSVEPRLGHGVAERFARTFGAPLMLLLDGEDSDGLLVRPRAGRLELGGDYAVGDQLRAASALAAGLGCCRRSWICGWTGRWIDSVGMWTGGRAGTISIRQVGGRGCGRWTGGRRRRRRSLSRRGRWRVRWWNGGRAAQTWTPRTGW